MLNRIGVQLCVFVTVAQLVGVVWSKNLSFRLEFAGGAIVQDSTDALLCPFVRHFIFCLVTVLTQEDNHLSDFYHNIPPPDGIMT